MADVDVRDLTRETLAVVPFPANRTESFRVHLSERVHQGVWTHASADTSHEICGVLVGTWARDPDGPFAYITEFIRCDNAAQKFAEVTFTHESWAQINGEMDTKYQALRIIGWYHSHPNFGIFLSDRDCFIQEHFFSGPGQIALVVDPVRKTEGIFEWRRGKPTPIHHFWVGDAIHLGVSQPQSEHGAMPSDGSAPAATAAPAEEPRITSMMVMLVAALMLLLGYLYGGRSSAWEQQRLAEGTVAHYGIWKLYKPGFEAYLTEVISVQTKIINQMKKVVAAYPKANDEARGELEKELRALQSDFDLTIGGLQTILTQYGLSDDERLALARLINQKVAELSGGTGTNSAQKPAPESSKKPSPEPEVKAKSGESSSKKSDGAIKNSGKSTSRP